MIITLALFGVFMCIAFWLGVKAGMKENLVKKEKFPSELIDLEEGEMEIIDGKD